LGFREDNRVVCRWRFLNVGWTVLQVRTLRGHSGWVRHVEFSDDGAQVISGSNEGTVRVWDVASGTQVRQLTGEKFALVEGPCDEKHRYRHVLTTNDDTLLIYKIAKELHAEDGTAAAVAFSPDGTRVVSTPVACFKAPKEIASVRCHGAAICVGCYGGAVCILSAPFLAT